jgi:hypothetical protein
MIGGQAIASGFFWCAVRIAYVLYESCASIRGNRHERGRSL